jgi:hypothetical protein
VNFLPFAQGKKIPERNLCRMGSRLRAAFSSPEELDFGAFLSPLLGH